MLRIRPEKSDSSLRPVVLITGCASGIGFALAELMVPEEHYRVVITARASSLSALHNRFEESERFIIRALDVASEADRTALMEEISKRWGA